MDGEQRGAFRAALGNDPGSERNYDSIMESIRTVDARKAECRNKEDQEAIQRELEERVGAAELNKLVRGELRGAVAREGRAALDAMGEEERGTSELLRNVGRLYEEMGQYEEAKPLYEEVLEGRRKALGDRDEKTLTAINDLGNVLYRMGQHE